MGSRKREDLCNLLSYSNIRVFFLSWLHFQMLALLSESIFQCAATYSVSLHLLLLSTPFFTVIHGCVLAVLQVHQRQGQPAGRSECFLALMRPECAWSMSTVGLTAQEISFPIEKPFLGGSYCHSMAGSKPSWNYRHELDK